MDKGARRVCKTLMKEGCLREKAIINFIRCGYGNGSL